MPKINIKKRVQRLIIAGLTLMFLSGMFSGTVQGFKRFDEPLKSHEIAQESGFVDVAHAATTPAPADPVKDATEDVIANLVSVITLILGALQRIFWPLILVMGGLMDNSLLFGWGMEERLLEIWQQIRNIVNIIFVVMLLGIALMNIIGVGGENYYLKTILPKFIIGLIAVNFSFLGMKVMLDALNVATASIFSLPSTLQVSPVPGIAELTKEEEKAIDDNNEIPPEEKDAKKGAVLDGKKTAMYTGTCKAICGPTGEGCEVFENEADMQTKQSQDGYIPLCYTFKKGADCKKIKLPNSGGEAMPASKAHCPSQRLVNTFIHFNGQNASIILAVRMMDMANLDQLSDVPKILGQKGGWEKLTMNIIFSLIMYIIYGTGFVVLFIVLIVRLAVLWLAIALSPVIVLKYVFPQLLEKVGGGDLETKIVQTAIAPLTIAFTMSVGFIMMDKFNGITGESMNTIFGDAKLGKPDEIMKSVMNLNTPAVSTIQQLFMAAATTAFVWMGIVAASSKSVAEKLTGTITGAVGKAGSWLAFAPFKYTGIVPVKGENVSMATMLKTMQSIPQSMDQKATDQMRSVFGIGETPGGFASDINNKVNTKGEMAQLLARTGASGYLTDKEVLKALRNKQHLLPDNMQQPIKNVDAATGELKEPYAGQLRTEHSNFTSSYTPTAQSTGGASAGTPAATAGATERKKEVLAELDALKRDGIPIKGEADLRKDLGAAGDNNDRIQEALNRHKDVVANMGIAKEGGGTRISVGNEGKVKTEDVQKRLGELMAVTNNDETKSKQILAKEIGRATGTLSDDMKSIERGRLQNAFSLPAIKDPAPARQATPKPAKKKAPAQPAPTPPASDDTTPPPTP